MAERDPDSDDLLAAYVDGVGELTPDERKRVEARLGELDADGTRAMIGELRALPPEGNEPDWRALQARIADAIDTPVSWWKRWLVPTGALVMTAAAALLWIHHTPDPEPAQPAHVVAVAAAHVDAAVPVPTAQPTPTEVWLDGQLIDVSDVDESAVLGDVDEPDAVTAEEDDGLLPAGDLGWVDQLDDHAIDRAEHWLERKKS